ncbi:CHAT domain-containing protein [Streptomyces sp. NPDC097619]|uniref:CHAT domain-containing protein n=1 Tax=Streptomyces sp. NPDC097619 TaxID=3157228 RepID=UPI00331B6148
MSDTVPPLAESARRLLAAADAMSVRLPERDRLMRALDLLAPEEWTRVCVVLPEDPTTALRRPARWFTPDDLGQVVEVAGTIARIYGYETVGLPHIAVALAATAETPVSEGVHGAHTVDGGDGIDGAAHVVDAVDVVDVVAEAFGLGELEDSRRIVEQHLLAVERAEHGEGGTPSAGVHWGPTGSALLRRRLAVLAHLAARAAAVALLLVIAARGDSAWAWPVALAAAVSSRDAREQEQYLLGERVTPLELRLRWPWSGCLAVLAGILGLTESALVIVALYALLAAVAALGEYGAARQVRMAGPEVARAGSHTRYLMSVAAVFPVRRRIERGVLVAAVAATPVALVWSGRTPYWVPLLCVAVFAARALSGLALVSAAAVLGAGWAGDSGQLPTLIAGAVGALLAGLSARAAVARAHRLPSVTVPLPRPGPWALVTAPGRAVRAAHRRLERGRPAAALSRLDRLDGVAGVSGPDGVGGVGRVGGVGGRLRPDRGHRLAQGARSDRRGVGHRGSEVAALRGWALLLSGLPGEARRAVTPYAGQGSHVHELVLFQAALDLSDRDGAERALAVIRAVPGPVPRTVRSPLQAAWLHLGVLRDEGPHLTDHIAELVPRGIDRERLLPAVTRLRLTAEAALPRTPDVAYYAAATAEILLRVGSNGGLDALTDRWLLGPGRPLGLEYVRCGAVQELAGLVVDGADTRALGRLGTREGVAGLLMRMERPLEAAATLNLLSDRLRGRPEYRRAALAARIDALAVLNTTRHQLRTTEERQRWWTVFGHTVEQAMAQAEDGRDWETLAELIETARLQLGPRAEGSRETDDGRTGTARARGTEAARGTGAEGARGTEEVPGAGAPDGPGAGAPDGPGAGAPFIRVRGGSRLEDAHWYRPEDRPRAYALEELAEAVLGPGTWWWSTWSAGPLVYWSLVPPEGPVRGGVLPCGPGSALATVLAELRDALPMPYPGEDDDALADRVLSSPLLVGPPPAEAGLARRLGLLVPDALVAALRAAGDRPLPLALAPAAALAHVPWAMIGIPGEGPAGDRSDLRLVERCRMAVAPPAALLAALCERPRRLEAPPLALALVDPGSDLGEPDAGYELPGARALLDELPEDVRALTPATDVSFDGLSRVLRGLGARGETSALIACHAVERVPSPLRGGIVLRPALDGADGGGGEGEEDSGKDHGGDGDDGDRADGNGPAGARVLTAGMLIAEPERFPMPRQVLMLCCDSGDLSGALNGEWLVLGTALLWAGADRLVVTSYPTVDAAEGQEEDDLIDHALVGRLVAGGPLLDGLRAVQLGSLAEWRRTGARGAPLHWAGHLAMGAFGPRLPLVPLAAARRSRVKESVVRLVDEAAGLAAAAGRDRVTLWDLMVQLGLYGYEEDLPLWRMLALRSVLYPYVIANSLREGRAAAREGAVGLSPEVVEVLRAAAGHARTGGHEIVETEHVLVAFLQAPGRQAAAARAVTGWDARMSDVHRDLLDEVLNGIRVTRCPQVRHLSAAAVTRLHEVMEAEPGRGDADGAQEKGAVAS